MTYYMPTSKKRAVRQVLFSSQNGRCVYCSRVMSQKPKDYRKANHATLDHLTPLALGGHSDADNLVLCCRLCNIVKGHSTLEEFVFGLLWVWLYKYSPAIAAELYGRLATATAP